MLLRLVITTETWYNSDYNSWLMSTILQITLSLSRTALHLAFPSSPMNDWQKNRKGKLCFVFLVFFVKIRSENFILSVTSLHFLSGHSRLLHLYQWMDCCFVEISRQQRIHRYSLARSPSGQSPQFVLICHSKVRKRQSENLTFVKTEDEDR